METLPTPDAFGHSIFCDDVRMEIRGKLTFVGCYFGAMYVHSDFPIVIPKFCISVNYWQRKNHLVLPVVFLAFLPGDSEDRASVEFGTTEQLTEEALEQQRRVAIESGLQDPQYEYSAIATQIALANLTISQPGSIKVRVRRGDKLLRIGSLRIHGVSNTTSAQQAAPPISPPS